MTSVLLDTNVLSELVRPAPEPRVIKFVMSLASPLISAMSVQEITFGLERTPSAVRRAKLSAWIGTLRQEFAGRVVEINWGVAESAAKLRASAASQGAPYDITDALIAACALERGAAVATRNVRDFAAFGVEVINPWEKV